jgi:hypothetical protein
MLVNIKKSGKGTFDYYETSFHGYLLIHGKIGKLDQGVMLVKSKKVRQRYN